MPSVPENKTSIKPKSLFLTTLLTSGAILLCRFSGLIRMIVLNSFFAQYAGAYDAFLTALRIPNTLRDLLAEGALSQSFTSVAAKKRQEEGEDETWKLVRKLGSQVFFLMIAVVIIGILISGPLVSTLFSKKSPEVIEYATFLTRIMWPVIAFISFGALVMGTLNILGRFALPMLASCAYNVMVVVAGLLLGWMIDPSFGPRALIGFAIAVPLGGAAQWLVQWPALHKAGFRFHFDFNWKDTYLSRIWRLMIPSAMAASVTQINVLINSLFALRLEDGSVAALTNGFILFQLPVGLFGVATGMIVLPDIARVHTDKKAVVEKLSQAFRQICFFALPSFVVLHVLSRELVSVLFQHGSFGLDNVNLTSMVLQSYAWGLFGYAGMKIIQPVFVALEKKWVPLCIAIAAFMVSVTLNYSFVEIFHLDCSWLAMTTSVISTLNFLAYYFILRLFVGHMNTMTLLKGIIRMLIASFAMAAICYLVKVSLLTEFTSWRVIPRIITFCLTVGTGGVFYLGIAWLMKAPEMMILMNHLKNRFFKRTKTHSHS